MPETAHVEPSLWGEPKTWVVIAFVLFFVLFGRKLWSVIAGILDNRAAAVREELAIAERLRREAEAMLSDAKAKRDAAVRDAEALIEGAKAEAERVTAAAAAEAEALSRRRQQMAMDRIAAAEKAVMDEFRTTAADVATVVARQVLSAGLPSDIRARLIDASIAHLPEALAGAGMHRS